MCSARSFTDSRCCTLTVVITSMPAVEDLLDVLIPLGVADAGDVGVGELVDEHDLRTAGEHGVEVHLLHELAVVLDLEAGDDLEAPDRLLGQLAAVGLDEADDDVLALGAAVVGLAEHREGLAAPGRGAEEARGGGRA